MNFYTQPQDELILKLLLEQGDYKDLLSYLKGQSMFEDVSERGIALDAAIDHEAVKVVEALRHSHVYVKVTQIAMEMGKKAVDAAVGALVAAWVKNRNEKKQREIEAKKDEPIILDQYGHIISLKPESKKEETIEVHIMDRPVPVGFLDIEDWILHHLYDHPKKNHSTQSLLKQLGTILEVEPSQLDEYNKRSGIFGAGAITAEEYAARRNPEFANVQRAVETLIKEGWAKGKRDTDAHGTVFFSGLDLTSSGTKEAISRARAKEEKLKPTRSFENTVRQAHERIKKKTTKD